MLKRGMNSSILKKQQKIMVHICVAAIEKVRKSYTCLTRVIIRSSMKMTHLILKWSKLMTNKQFARRNTPPAGISIPP